MEDALPLRPAASALTQWPRGMPKVGGELSREELLSRASSDLCQKGKRRFERVEGVGELGVRFLAEEGGGRKLCCDGED